MFKDQFSRVEQGYAAELRCRPDGRKEIRSPAKTVPGIRPFVSRTRRRAAAESGHIRLFSWLDFCAVGSSLITAGPEGTAVWISPAGLTAGWQCTVLLRPPVVMLVTGHGI